MPDMTRRTAALLALLAPFAAKPALAKTGKFGAASAEMNMGGDMSKYPANVKWVGSE